MKSQAQATKSSPIMWGAQEIRLVLAALLVICQLHQVATVLVGQQRTEPASDPTANNNDIYNNINYPLDGPSVVSLRSADEPPAGFTYFVPLLRNLRIKDIDQVDNYKLLPNSKVLEEILNELSQELAAPEHQKRTGRAQFGVYAGESNRRQPGAGMDLPTNSWPPVAYNRYQSQTSQQQPRGRQTSTNRQPQQVPSNIKDQDGSPSAGAWAQPANGPSYGSGSRAGGRRFHAPNPRHTSQTAEVAIPTPLKSRSVSEYDWKRVENSRWNNLRGMWGKRSVSPDGAADRDEAGAENRAQQQQQQQQQQQSGPAPGPELSAPENKQEQRMVANGFM